MKISKALLGAILVGIAVQTTTSCTKTDKQAMKVENDKPTEQTPPPPTEPCPACGMG